MNIRLLEPAQVELDEAIAGARCASSNQGQIPTNSMTKPMFKRNTPTTQPSDKADSELLLKGILCALIGLGVLISPYFIKSPGMQDIVANSSLVGWFALVLGCAFIVLYAVRRRAAGSK